MAVGGVGAGILRRLRLLRDSVLIGELGVFLVAFGGEADVVELDFVDTQAGYVFGEGNVVVLDFGVAGIGPDEFAVFPPGRFVLAGLDGQFGVLDDQELVAKDGNSRDGVHVLLGQEVDELRYVVDVNVVLAEQGVLEGDGDAAVGIFDIEDDRIAADFAPVLDDAKSVIARSHDAGEVDGADFEVAGNRNGLLGDGRGEKSGDEQWFVA